MQAMTEMSYRQATKISHTLISYTIVYLRRWSDYTSILDLYLALMDCTKTTARQDEKLLSAGIWCALY